MKNIIILSNDNSIEEVLRDYWFDTYTTSFDRIIFYWLHKELLEKYSLSMQLLCTKWWVHINTLFRTMYYLKIHDKQLYLKLIPRIRKFLSIYRIKILVYWTLDEEITILNEIWVVYNVYPKFWQFIVSLKKTLCQ